MDTVRFSLLRIWPTAKSTPRSDRTDSESFAIEVDKLIGELETLGLRVLAHRLRLSSRGPHRPYDADVLADE